MKKYDLLLERAVVDGLETFRTVIKNAHGRKIYYEVVTHSTGCIEISDCWYADRNIGKTGEQRKSSVPTLLKTKFFANETEMLNAIARELDRKFGSVKFIIRKATLHLTALEYVDSYLQKEKFNFLLLQKTDLSENTYELETVLKNKTHRVIYLKLLVTKETCAITNCYYTDRTYKNAARKVMPPTVYSTNLSFTKAEILRFCNAELVCDFTDIIIADESFFKIVNISKPICGSI